MGTWGRTGERCHLLRPKRRCGRLDWTRCHRPLYHELSAKWKPSPSRCPRSYKSCRSTTFRSGLDSWRSSRTRSVAPRTRFPKNRIKMCMTRSKIVRFWDSWRASLHHYSRCSKSSASHQTSPGYPTPSTTTAPTSASSADTDAWKSISDQIFHLLRSTK